MTWDCEDESAPENVIWSAKIVKRFVKDAPHELAEALMFANLTGQTVSQLCSLTWTDWDGQQLPIWDENTFDQRPVPASSFLRHYLNNMERRGEFILTDADGKPWTPAGLSDAFNRCAKKLGYCNVEVPPITVQLTLSDTRRTFIKALVDAGCDIGQIRAITGYRQDTLRMLMSKSQWERANKALHPALH